MSNIELTETELGVLKLRFYGRLIAGSPNGDCWIWNPDARHYGRLRWKGRMLSAHRVAILVATGKPVRDDKQVLHAKCDHPPCCNPAHLRVGTPSDNAKDAFAKGRRSMEHCNAVTMGPSRIR